MSIRPVELNGMIQRTQDVSTLKQQEDAKPVVDQQNIQNEVVKAENRLTKQVVEADDTRQEEFRYDAREKGSSEYHGNDGKGKKKKKQKDGKVIIKGMEKGFDVKI